MLCPKCGVNLVCGCKACKANFTADEESCYLEFINDEEQQCTSCGYALHCDQWLDIEVEYYAL